MKRLKIVPTLSFIPSSCSLQEIPIEMARSTSKGISEIMREALTYGSQTTQVVHGLTLRHLAIRTLEQARRLVVIVIGFTILAAGLAMIVLPGPAVVVIPVGLALLATEFIWARTLLVTVKEQVERMRKGVICRNNQ